MCASGRCCCSVRRRRDALFLTGLLPFLIPRPWNVYIYPGQRHSHSLLFDLFRVCSRGVQAARRCSFFLTNRSLPPRAVAPPRKRLIHPVGEIRHCRASSAYLTVTDATFVYSRRRLQLDLYGFATSNRPQCHACIFDDRVH